MLKKYILFVIIFLNVIVLSAQDYLNESFNSAVFPPSGWIVNKVSGAESWKHNKKEKAAFADSGSATIEDAWLITPQINITLNSVLHFKVKADELVPPDNLYVKVSTTGTEVKDFNKEVFAIKVGENVSKKYQKYIVDLKTFVGKKIYIGFHHKTEFAYTDSHGDSYNGSSGFFLDDVVVTSKQTKDVEVKTLLSPHNGDLIENNKAVVVQLKNTGNVDILTNKIKVSYTINNESTVEETVPSELKIGKTLVYEFKNSARITEGVHTIKITATIPNDANKDNDIKTYKLEFNTNKSLVEDFSGVDFLPAGWESYYLSGPYANKLQKLNNTAFIKSTAVMQGNDMLITPKIIIKSNYVLKFSMNAPDYLSYYANNPSMIAKDELTIKISETKNKKTDFKTVVKTINLKKHYAKGVYDENSYKDFTVDLGAYAGKRVYIAFDYINQDGFGIGINKIEVGKSSALSVNKAEADYLVSVYPNPATNHINISNVKKGTALLYNFSGKEIIRKKISNQDNIIDIWHLASGVYFLKIEKNKAIVTKKIIKK